MKKDLIQIIVLYNTLSEEDKNIFNSIFNLSVNDDAGVSVKVGSEIDYTDLLKKFQTTPWDATKVRPRDYYPPVIQPYTLQKSPDYDPLKLWCGIGNNES